MLGYDENGNTLNVRGPVYRQMILDICANYSSLPDVRTMTYNEIEFFYSGIKGVLKRNSKPGN